MGRIINAGQLIDVVEYLEENNKQIVWKYARQGNEIKHGARLIVRPGQAAILVCRGQLADVFGPGHFVLKTKNLPILSTLIAIPFGFNSPIKSDVFFIDTTQFFGMHWETDSPILKRDPEMGMVRISARGTYAFQITQPGRFLTEMYGARKMDNTAEISAYLSSFVAEAVAQCIGEMRISVLDLAMNFRNMSQSVSEFAAEKAEKLGIAIPEATIDGIILPKEVEKLIDEQSGIGLAARNMDNFMQYQTARAMRDAARQSGGLAGLGASFALGDQITRTTQQAVSGGGKSGEKDIPAQLREWKRMVSEGVLTEQEFEAMKSRILSGAQTPSAPAVPPAPPASPAPAPVSRPQAYSAPPQQPAYTPPPVRTAPQPPQPAPAPAPAVPQAAPYQRKNGPANSPASAYAVKQHVCFGGLRWQVIKQTSPTHALIVCDETVNEMPYRAFPGPVTWEDCDVRKWLNGTFLKGQFSARDQRAVMVNPLRPEQSAIWNVNPGRPTTDAVFCLGAREFTKMLPEPVRSSYWLRSPGKSAAEVAVVTPDGRIKSIPAETERIAVRPAVWLDLTAL